MNLCKIKNLLLLLGCLSLFEPTLLHAQQHSVDELVGQARQKGIEQSALEELQNKALARGMGEQELTAVINHALTLARQQLPADHIVQKALEGMSKGVPNNQIVQVLDNMRGATEQAAGVILPWVKEAEVQKMVARSGQSVAEFQSSLVKSASKAVTQNVPATVINEVLSDINDEAVLSNTEASNIVTAIGILPDLPTTSGQPEVSKAFIVRALKEGFKSTELQKLPTALSVAQMRSQLPASNVIQGVAGQLKEGIPAAQILQNLFDGNIGGGPQGNIPKGLENRKGQGNN